MARSASVDEQVSEVRRYTRIILKILGREGTGLVVDRAELNDFQVGNPKLIIMFLIGISNLSARSRNYTSENRVQYFSFDFVVLCFASINGKCRLAALREYRMAHKARDALSILIDVWVHPVDIRIY